MASDVMARGVASSHVTRIPDGEKVPPSLVVHDVPKKASTYSVKFWYLHDDNDDNLSGGDTAFLGADLFRRTEGLSWRGSTSGESCSSDDTDLEDVPDIEYATGRVHHDPTPSVGTWTYSAACTRMQVAPQSAICTGLGGAQLGIPGRNLGPRDLIPLAKALKCNTELSTLDLSGNGTSGSAMLEMANALRWNHTIRRLNLSDNKLGVLGAAALAEVMRCNTGITTLDLSYNNFNDEAAKFIALGIETTDRLVNINLSHNKIGETGGVYIGARLKKTESVQILDISWNKLVRKGIVMVIQALQENMVTTHVNLAHNGMGYEGSLALKQMLKAGTYVVELDVTANRINWKCAQMIAAGIKVNENLEILKIGKNPLTTTGCMDIIDAVASPTCCIRSLDLTDQPVTRDFEIMAQTIKHIRDFEYKHGGFVSCHDIIGRRTGFKVDPMNKMAAFLRNKKIRMTDLFSQMNKNANIQMTVDEFVSGLKTTGLSVDDDDIDSIMNKIKPKVDGYGIDYRTFLNTMRDQALRERREKVLTMKRKAFTKEFHSKILNPSLPPVAENQCEENVHDVVHNYRHRTRQSLPPISGGSGGCSTPIGVISVDDPSLGLYDSSVGSIPGSAGVRKMAPGIMSMTRAIGAKSKQFGTDVKKKKKKKKKSHTKGGTQVSKKKATKQNS